MNNKLSISNILIIISIVITFLATIMPSLYMFWINNSFLHQWLYHIYIIQFFTGTFLHWWLFHLFLNSFFINYFWNIVEWLMWKKKYFIFFMFSTFFIWLLVTYFSNWNHIWISGFCMALLSYFTLELRSRNDPDYKWWITAILLNIWIWIIPGISLYWHLFGAIAWVIFYLITKDFFRTKYVWLDVEI